MFCSSLVTLNGIIRLLQIYLLSLHQKGKMWSKKRLEIINCLEVEVFHKVVPVSRCSGGWGEEEGEEECLFKIESLAQCLYCLSG